MNSHPTFTQIMNMDHTAIDLGLPQDVGRKNPLYWSSSPRESTSFHHPGFELHWRVPRRLLGVLLLLLTFGFAPVMALTPITKEGKAINVKSELVEGKKNLIFFHASWSKTSSRYKVELERWEKTNSDVHIMLVDVLSLRSPVSKQFRLETVPAFRIYDRDGELVSEGQEAHNEVVKMLKE